MPYSPPSTAGTRTPPGSSARGSGSNATIRSASRTAAIAQFGDPAAAARDALGDEGYERVYEQGFSLDLDGIRTLVLAEGALNETSGSSR